MIRRSMRRLRQGLSFANMVSVVALFVALGGSAWAVAANSIGPRQLRENAVRAKHVKANQIRAKHISRNQVRPKHIRDNSVRTSKIPDGAVTAAKLADGVGGPRGPAGPQGSAGPQGDQSPAGPQGQAEPQGPVGLQGDRGPAGATNVVVRRDTSPSSFFPDEIVTCNAGERAVGGGASTSVSQANLDASHPLPTVAGATPNGWRAASHHDTTPHTVTVFVVCASP